MFKEREIPIHLIKLIGKKLDVSNNELLIEIQDKIPIKRRLKDIINKSLTKFVDSNKYSSFDNEGHLFEKNVKIKNKNKQFINQIHNYNIKNFSKEELNYYSELLGINYILQPITNFYFYCHYHGFKNTFYCLDCKTHLCDKCKELSSLSEEKAKIIIKVFISAPSKGFNYRKILANFLKDNKFKDVNEALEYYLSINNIPFHKRHSLVKLDKYKLTEEEMKYYDDKIKLFSEKLEKSKNIGGYDKNSLLLKYCKYLFEFYKNNLKKGFIYSIIFNIRKNIKFNEKFLIQNNEENNNKLILNIPFEEENKSIFFLNEINCISCNEQIKIVCISEKYSKILIGKDMYKPKFLIYEMNSFDLLHSINIKGRIKNAAFLSNGNIMASFEEWVYDSYYSILIKFDKKDYLIKTILPELSIMSIIEILKNKQYAFAIKTSDIPFIKIGIYSYKYQNVLYLTPFYDKLKINENKKGHVEKLLYYSKINILLLVIKEGYNIYDYSQLTAWNTSHSLYKFLWSKNNIKYGINIINDRFLFFDNGIYDLKSGEYKYKFDFNIYEDLLCFGKSNIYLDKKYINQFDLYETKDNSMEIKSISKFIIKDTTPSKYIKLTENIICLFNGYENEAKFYKF